MVLLVLLYVISPIDLVPESAHVLGVVDDLIVLQPLGRRAQATLRRLGYERIHLRTGDGYRGWPEAAPFDVFW